MWTNTFMWLHKVPVEITRTWALRAGDIGSGPLLMTLISPSWDVSVIQHYIPSWRPCEITGDQALTDSTHCCGKTESYRYLYWPIRAVGKSRWEYSYYSTSLFSFQCRVSKHEGFNFPFTSESIHFFLNIYLVQPYIA